MGDRIKVFSGDTVFDPKTLLPGRFEARVVTFTFRPQSVHGFECDGIPVNGKPVVIRDGDIFGTAAILFAVIPVVVITRANPGFTALERATELLTCTTFTFGFYAFVHGKPRLA